MNRLNHYLYSLDYTAKVLGTLFECRLILAVKDGGMYKKLGALPKKPFAK